MVPARRTHDAHFARVRLPPSYSCSKAVFASTLTITEAQMSGAVPLEPAFENLLRSATVHESIIWALCINEINDRATFCALDSRRASSTGLIIAVPEDVGCHRVHAPTSLWCPSECSALEGGSGALRGAGFLCTVAVAARKNRK